MPLKRLLTANDGGVWGDDPKDGEGTVVLRSTDQSPDGAWRLSEPALRALSARERVTATLVEGDLLVTKSSGSAAHIGKTTYVTQQVAQMRPCFSNFMQRLRVRPGVEPRIVWYWLNSDLGRQHLAQLSNTTTGLANLNAEILGRLRIPAVPREEQRRIAAFLDFETARIDELVQEQARLQGLVNEERSAVISTTVFDDAAARPAVKLALLVDILTGPAFKSEDYSDVAGGVRLLRGINVAVNRLRWDETVYWPGALDADLSRYLLREDDVVLGMDRPWIAAGARQAIIQAHDLPALLVQRVARLRTRPTIVPELVRFALASDEFRAFVEADLTGVSVPHISSEQIGSFRIPVFTVDEQRSRLTKAQARLEILEEAVDQSEVMVKLLLERRSALITAAVTGQIDVRPWRPPDDWSAPEAA